MGTELHCHSCGAAVRATTRRCPSCYVALGAATRPPSPLRASPSATATPSRGQLALAPTPASPTPAVGRLALVSPLLDEELAAHFEGSGAGYAADARARRPEDTSSPAPGLDFQFSPPAGAPPGFELLSYDVDDAGPDTVGGRVIVGPWPNRPVVVRHASWRQRALAALIDGAFFVPALLASAVSVTAGGVLLGAAVAFSVWQLCFLQGRTGQTVGKHRVGLFLVREAGLTPIGTRRAALRLLAHGIDAALLGVGFLWPLWDAKQQTFADQLLQTIVAVG